MNDIEEFRHNVREWLEENCPKSMRGLMPADEMVWGGRTIDFKNDDQRLWFERMRDKGWFCPSWPVEYGGGGLSAEQTTVLETEMRKLRCRPPQINLFGCWAQSCWSLVLKTKNVNYYHPWRVVKSVGAKASPSLTQVLT